MTLLSRHRDILNTYGPFLVEIPSVVFTNTPLIEDGFPHILLSAFPAGVSIEVCLPVQLSTYIYHNYVRPIFTVFVPEDLPATDIVYGIFFFVAAGKK